MECAVQIIPQLLTAAIEMIGALAQGLAENLPQLISAAEEGLAQLIEGIYYPLFQFIHFDASRHSKLKASKVSRGEAKVI